MSNIPTNTVEKQRIFIIRFVYGTIIALCIYAVIKWAMPVLFPFVLAALFAVLLYTPIRALSQRLRIRRILVCIPVLILFFLALGLVLLLIGNSLLSGITDVISLLSSFMDTTVFPAIEEIVDDLSKLVGTIAPQSQINFSDILPTFQKVFSTVSSWLVSIAASLASSVPSLLLKTIITVIATAFITIDYENIKTFIVRQIPDNKKAIVEELRTFVGGTLLKCLGSYIMIFGITFIELLIGFWLLSIPNALLLAALIAIVDILPVLGTGSVLIPWGIFSLVLGNYGMGAGILILYLVITIIRNTIEPKLVGKQMQMHPMVTFAVMLLGLKWMGFLGMLGFPLTLAFVNSLNKKGIIHLYR